MYSQTLPESSSLPLFCGGRRVWIRIFSFLHKHKHNAINTSPLTFPSQFSTFGKDWDTKESDHYSLKWIDGVLKKSQK